MKAGNVFLKGDAQIMSEDLFKVFEKYNYTSIKEHSKAEEYGIEVRYLYDENDNTKYPDELMDIYISENKNDLFILLNCDYCEDMNNVCNVWDQKLLMLTNFGMNNLYKLKYNMVQLLICTGDNINRIIEGSVNISRKIILKCEKDENNSLYINEDEAVEIPFYMPEFKEILNDKELNVELNKIIPNNDLEENTIFFKQYQKKNRSNNNIVYSMTEEVQKRFESWLKKYEDQKD